MIINDEQFSKMVEPYVENEKANLKDYLYWYCENPYALMSEKLKSLFIGSFDSYALMQVSMILADSEVNGYLNYSPFMSSDEKYYIFFEMGEIEIFEVQNAFPDVENIEDFLTIRGDLGYYYIGYGYSIIYDGIRVKGNLAEVREANEGQVLV